MLLTLLGVEEFMGLVIVTLIAKDLVFVLVKRGKLCFSLKSRLVVIKI